MLLPRLLRGANTTTRSLKQLQQLQSKAQCTRYFSSQRKLHQQLVADDMKHLPDIDPSQLEVTNTITPKQLVPNQDLVFGRTFTGESAGEKYQTSCGNMLTVSRSYAINRMDSKQRMASTTNDTLPEPLARSRDVCIPLCFRSV